MSRRFYSFLLLLVFAVAMPRAASASAIVLLGLDPTADAHSYTQSEGRQLVLNSVTFAAGKADPRIALFTIPELAGVRDGFGLDSDDVFDMLSLNYTRFAPGDLATGDFSAFDLMYFGPTTNKDAIDTYFQYRDTIANFALAGKGLVVEPNVRGSADLYDPVNNPAPSPIANAWAWVPFASEIGHSGDENQLNMGPGDVVQLAVGAPAGLIGGLTNDGLSLWGGSYHTQFTNPFGGGYQPFAYRGDTDPTTAIALYLDTTATPTPEPGTMVLLGSGAVAAALRRRRRK